MTEKRDPKKWYGDGIYSKTRAQSDGKALEMFYGRAWIPEERRFRYFKLGSTEKQARKKMRKVLGDPSAAVAAREKVAEKPLLFDELVKRFLAEYRPRGNSEHYVQRAKAWNSYFSGWRVADVDFKAVEGFREFRRRAHWRQGKGKSKRVISDGTLREDLISLGTLFKWAVRRRLATHNPVEHVARPPKPDREVTVLTADEETKLLGTADPQSRTVIAFFLASGMRRGEGLDLRWGQVDRAGGAILVHKSKTGKARAIALNEPLTAALEGAIKALRSDILQQDIRNGKKPDAHVLCDPDGKPFDPFVITRAVESAMEAAGITKTRGAIFNLFRHTFGSRLAERGVEMGTIATLMGNSPDICFKHYIRFSPEHLKAAMAHLDRPAPDRIPGVARSVARHSDGTESLASEPQLTVDK